MELGRIDLSGKIAVVFGGSKGLGFQVALQLLQLHATVYLTIEAPIVISTVEVDSVTEKLKFIEANPLQLSSVILGAEQIQLKQSRIDILVNCTNDIYLSYQCTKDGFERTLQTNYLAPTLFLNTLLPSLLNSPHASVINLVNDAYRYPQFHIYDFKQPTTISDFCFLEELGLTQLYLITLTRELSRRLKNTNILINCIFTQFNPNELLYQKTDSVWYSELIQIMFQLVNSFTGRDAEILSNDLVYLFINEKVDKLSSGQAWYNQRVQDVDQCCMDPYLAKSLFNFTNVCLNLKW